MRYYLVDAFTDKPFGGNPAVVCLLERALDDATMAAVAREMNLSETAFLLREEDEYRLRWFTPRIEIRLCGHATLAAARALREAGMATGPEVAFRSLGGRLVARYDGELIELDFPALPAEAGEPPADLFGALGIGPDRVAWVGVNGHRNWLVELPDERTVRTLSPDRGRTMALPVHGVMVTARAHNADYDFVSRFFAPEAGVFEDPVTGSAHCALAPYWAGRLGKRELSACQASERGGFLRVRLDGDRVRMAGRSVVVAGGRFLFHRDALRAPA